MSESDLIVVGVDGSAHSRRALKWAVNEGRSHQMRVMAVCTWSGPPPPANPASGPAPGAVTDEQVAASTRAMLDAVIEEVVADIPEVDVERRVVQSNPSQELIAQSEHAAMVVVGAKGYGGFIGMLIGSVSQHVLTHSKCTVVVVR